MARNGMEQALTDYHEALAQRFERLGTRHSYVQAKDAAGALERFLHGKALVDLASIGIGLTSDRRDVRLIVNLANGEGLAEVPTSFRGIDVTANVSGEVSML